ncbi:hypothetical protein NT07LI_0717, partial [Listeria innocua FSL S4-378]
RLIFLPPSYFYKNSDSKNPPSTPPTTAAAKLTTDLENLPPVKREAVNTPIPAATAISTQTVPD